MVNKSRTERITYLHLLPKFGKFHPEWSHS